MVSVNSAYSYLENQPPYLGKENFLGIQVLGYELDFQLNRTIVKFSRLMTPLNT